MPWKGKHKPPAELVVLTLKSHKKYYYAMQEYPEDIIVLVDDDMFYPYNTVEKLMKMHEKYPSDICTMTAQVIVKEKNPSEWRNPNLNEGFIHSNRIQICSGSLIKKEFDKKSFK